MKRSEISTQTLAVKSYTQDLKKGCEIERRRRPRNTVGHIKNDDPGHKTLWHLKVIIINIFNVIYSIPAQALATPFWFHIFFITAFFQATFYN